MLAEAAEAHRETFPRLRSQYSVSLATLLDEGRAISTCEYIEALAHRAAFQRDLRATFTGIDALILPATTCTAPRDLTTTGDASFNSPWSFAGVPVVSLPCGLADDGMPAAVQLVGPELSEAALLASALWCEKVFGFDARPELPDNGLGDVKARPIGP
jgi:Asp-tRNA(Asn)/Glu-tRNA(Gln) amidotransferase A subunit family amidase